jgi:hypothetical protein
MLQETGARRQQIEQQPHAGPFAGPKPEPMTVPRGASRSNRRAHPSRLGWARGFLPSWPCEFDSRHPLQSEGPSQGPLSQCHPGSALQPATVGPIRGPMDCGVTSGPLSPSFPVGHASSILVTRSTAAFLVVALSGLAASSARTIFDFRARCGLLASSPLDQGIQGSRRRGGSCLLRRGICKIDVQRAAASAELTVWTSSSHDAMNFSTPSASKAATTSW